MSNLKRMKIVKYNIIKINHPIILFLTMLSLFSTNHNKIWKFYINKGKFLKKNLIQKFNLKNSN